MKKQKRILVAPLNWGLGHATRCIPIINKLLEQNVELLLGSDGNALRLLRAEYPNLPFVELPPYNVTYRSPSMIRSIAPQVPKLLRAIGLERQFLDNIIKPYKISALLSDNRYGLYHPDIPCALLSHQLNIQMPWAWLQKLFARLNQSYIRKFDQCWVPDYEGANNLAGDLSHGSSLPNLYYTGPLSRMLPANLPKKYDVIAVLSGPEPQRSYFEEQIVAQARKLPLRFLIVQGKADAFRQENIAPNIESCSFLTSRQLNQAILESQYYIARSGYSTLMDVVALGLQDVIFVPTPGQTEQEYLAKRCFDQGYFYYQPQEKLNIEQAIRQVSNFSGLQQTFSDDLLEKTIQQFLELI